MNRSFLVLAAWCCAFSLPARFLVLAGESATPPPVKDKPSEPGAKPTPDEKKIQDHDKDPAPDKDPAHDKAPAPDDPPEKKDNSARYLLPKDADSDALVDFCMQLQDYVPEDDAEELIHDKKMPRAIRKACRRILQIEKDLESDNARFARRILLADKLDANPDIDAARTGELIKKVRAFLTSPKATREDAEVAAALADFLGAHVSPKSIEWSEQAGKDLAGHKDPDLASAGTMLQGTARRLKLVGHPFPLKGTTLDGKAFDVANLKDKVVLVVFWATWCEHCVAEIPNLQQCYEAYHAKGFEIVAISADDERRAAESFVKTEKIPWINLYDNNGRHPAMDEFGIIGFPSTILIGKDGNVVLLELRDKALPEQLEKILGAPDTPPITLKNEPKKEDPPHKAEPPKSKGDAPETDDGDTKEALKKKFSF